MGIFPNTLHRLFHNLYSLIKPGQKGGCSICFDSIYELKGSLRLHIALLNRIYHCLSGGLKGYQSKSIIRLEFRNEHFYCLLSQLQTGAFHHFSNFGTPHHFHQPQMISVL